MSSPFRALIASVLLFVSGLTAANAADLGADRGLGYRVPAAFVPTPSWCAPMSATPGWTFSSVSVDNTWDLGAGIGISCGGGMRGGAGERFTPYIGIGVGAAYPSTSSGTVTLTCGGTCNFDGEARGRPRRP